MYIIMPVIFIAGIIAIAFEDALRINKAATAIGMSVLLWMMVLADGTNMFNMNGSEMLETMIKNIPSFSELSVSEQVYKFLEFSIVESLGDVSETLFFVLGSMAIIELVDSHGGFEIIVNSITTRNKRKLLWIISFLTFFLSSLLGNLATVIVVVALLRRIIGERADRLIFAGMTIIAANAGGAWSPIGDVTTLLLWTGGTITVLHQVTQLILPSLAMMSVPLIYTTFTFSKDAVCKSPKQEKQDPFLAKIDPRFKRMLLVTGLISLGSVPVLQSLLHLPPFMGILLGLSIMWVMTDRRWTGRMIPVIQELRVQRVFSRIDVPTVLFFLGILMSVASLKTAGHLGQMSGFLDSVMPSPEVISLVLGVTSSFLDNVALVAGTIGMYPLAAAGPFMTDGNFWTFLAYCAVTGGSILIIGSASGVTVMGLEKIPFGYYLKKFSLLALLGYFAGAAVYLLLF
ncbi:MAG: sodium:proton antiporter [Bacteroidetes bacterium HGW-Bacteroidetes-10]|nr:MAG: sodium:proton antiporter [Bacteroidetes bacterium HGW-Bacteroidetes-10]